MNPIPGQAKESVNRRTFFASLKDQVLRWAPWLGLFGFHIRGYRRPLLVGWQGSLEWCGRLVGFVRLDGTIQWWP